MSCPMGSLILPMIQNLETTLKSRPQVPQFRPPPVTPNVNKPSTAMLAVLMKKADADDGDKKSGKEQKLPTTTTPAKVESVSSDPLGDAQSKVQEEIMASETLQASEAAALATRKVMQRYGHSNVAVQQS